MVSRVLLLVAATSAGALAYFAPPDLRLPVAVGAVVFVGGLYAVRERAALRHLNAMLRRLLDAEGSHRASLAKVQAKLESHAVAARGLSSGLEGLAHAVDRVEEAGKELSALHGVAFNETTARLAAQQEEVLRRLEQVEKQLEGQLTSAGHRLGYTATQTELRRLHSEGRTAAYREFRQTEALLGLHATFQVRAPMPPSRKWAASPDILLYLTSLVLDRRPRTVVELGGGLSTLWLAYALERVGQGGRLVALDHDAGFADRTRAYLAAHGLEAVAEVRTSPLKDIELDGEVWPWYDLQSLADVDHCELLFVDGPPGATRERARYPALPLLVDRLATRAMVVLDDCVRQDEKDVATAWRDGYPDWEFEELDHEKGTTVISRRPSSSGSTPTPSPMPCRTA